jgi:hypothetical protein
MSDPLTRWEELVSERVTELLKKVKKAKDDGRPNDVKEIELIIKTNLKVIGLKECDYAKYLNERMPN